jgi:hypothetical protein
MVLAGIWAGCDQAGRAAWPVASDATLIWARQPAAARGWRGAKRSGPHQGPAMIYPTSLRAITFASA